MRESHQETTSEEEGVGGSSTFAGITLTLTLPFRKKPSLNRTKKKLIPQNLFYSAGTTQFVNIRDASNHLPVSYPSSLQTQFLPFFSHPNLTAIIQHPGI